MKIVCERHEDLELKELYDAGMDVSWLMQRSKDRFRPKADIISR